MNKLLKKLIVKEKVTDRNIADVLYEICEREHSSCSEECPVFEEYGEIPWNKTGENCKCFKDGKKMLEFLRR